MLAIQIQTIGELNDDTFFCSQGRMECKLWYSKRPNVIFIGMRAYHKILSSTLTVQFSWFQWNMLYLSLNLGKYTCSSCFIACVYRIWFTTETWIYRWIAREVNKSLDKTEPKFQSTGLILCVHVRHHVSGPWTFIIYNRVRVPPE